MKLTPKQDRFCQRYVELGDASAAYRAVYQTDKMKPATINRNAKALLDNSKIATRIKTLRQNHQQRHDLTVDKLTEQIEEARKLALDRGQPAAAVSACLAMAKIHGLAKRPRDLPVPIPLSGTLTEQGQQVIAALGEGKLPASDAAAILQALAAQSKVTEIDELERRVSELEKGHEHRKTT